MRSLALLLIVTLLVLFGCAQEKTAPEEKSGGQMKAEAPMQAPAPESIPEHMEPAQMVAARQETARSIAPRMGPPRAEEEMPAMEKTVPAEPASMEGWSLSVFDPGTGMTQYYSSNGEMLGSK